MIGYGSPQYPAPQPQDSIALTVRTGIARFEQYLARHAAFALYLKETGRS